MSDKTQAKLVKLTINGKEIQAPEGANLLQVAKNNGIHIAHYCYHEGLPIAGVCRLCLVEVDGPPGAPPPKPQPSCNMTVREGMKVVSNSEKINEIVQWGLQFHLINHPLDCPICDQAGECILQKSYMWYGAYDSNMTQTKVHKKKVIDLGPRIVLDKERCILCARCTRFTDHVTKTFDLGIFNRGDHSEVGTYHDRPFDNTYSENTVDICPVGALTSKSFRFKQRVWFTNNNPSICIKCSTGCNINISSNTHGSYRVTPRKNMQVNTWWMCDEGRDAHGWLNVENRYISALRRREGKLETVSTVNATKCLQELPVAKIHWLISPQHTVEEYFALYRFFKTQKVQDQNIYLWYDDSEKLKDFDGLLLRGDKSPNSNGLKSLAGEFGYGFDVSKFNKQFFGPQGLREKPSHLVILGPENFDAHPGCTWLLSELPDSSIYGSVYWLGGVRLPEPSLEKSLDLVLPTKVFAEKNGTFINALGLSQQVKSFLKAGQNTADIREVFASWAP